VKLVTIGDWVVAYQFAIESIKSKQLIPDLILKNSTSVFQILFEAFGIEGLTSCLNKLIRNKPHMNTGDQCDAMLDLLKSTIQQNQDIQPATHKYPKLHRK
jgi:hypothetical protein